METLTNITSKRFVCCFFPGSKFSKNEKEDPFAPCADVCVENREACAIATVTLSHAGRTATATHKEPCDGAEKVSAERIACGKAFLEAGKALTGITPSWGILTGVRPAKLAIDSLTRGKSKQEVRSFLAREYLVNPEKGGSCHRYCRNGKKNPVGGR